MRNARVLPDTPTMRPASTVRFFLELFTLARSDSTTDYRYDLGIRVSVRGHLEVGGKLDAQDDGVSGLCLVAYQSGDLDALRKCRVILPDHRVRRDLGVLVLRYPRACKCDQSGGDKELLFHAAYSLQMDNGE